MFGVPVLAFCEYQCLLQERFYRSSSKRSCRQRIGISFHLWIAKNVVIASLGPVVAYQMRHLVSEKALERKGMEPVYRLLSNQDLAPSIHGSAGSDVGHVPTSWKNVDVRNCPAIGSRDFGQNVVLLAGEDFARVYVTQYLGFAGGLCLDVEP